MLQEHFCQVCGFFCIFGNIFGLFEDSLCFLGGIIFIHSKNAVYDTFLVGFEDFGDDVPL
jgi:hypothetical protein